MATTDTLKAHAKRIERRDKIISLVTRSLTPLRYGSEPIFKSSEIDPGDVAAFLCLPLAICGFSDYPPVCSGVARTSTRMPLGRHKLVIPGCITKAVDLHCTVQVKTNWDWKDVHNADLYLEGVERLWNGNATSEKYAPLYNQSSSYSFSPRRAVWLREEFEKLGLRASVQSYSLETKSGVRSLSERTWP